jgi:hypothetical protein
VAAIDVPEAKLDLPHSQYKTADLGPPRARRLPACLSSGGGMIANNADFITKLVQIEELANSVNGELPEGLLIERMRMQHIVVLAKNLRARLEFGAIAIVPVEPKV